MTTGCANVWPAGDHVTGIYPTTIEGVISNGVALRTVLASSHANAPKTFVGENQILPFCPDLDDIGRIANNIPQT